MSADSRSGFLAVNGTLLGLGIITVGLRLYARRAQRLPLKADDALAVMALMLFMAAVICEIRLVQMGMLGTSYVELKEALKKQASVAVRWAVAWDAFSAAGSAFIKLSALFFYRRLFTVPGSTKKLFHILSLTTIVIVSLWLVAFVIAPFFQCGTHLNALWNGTSKQYCTHAKRYFLTLVISNFVLDLWILVLPMPIVAKLHTSTARKLSIIGVFLLAFAGLGASLARMIIYLLIESGGTAYARNHDLGHAQTRAAYMTMLEQGISLVAVNLPSLWFLLNKITPEKALRSVRSVFSLSSIRSNRSSANTVPKELAITKRTDVMSHESESTTVLHGTTVGHHPDGMAKHFPGDLEAGSGHHEAYLMTPTTPTGMDKKW